MNMEIIGPLLLSFLSGLSTILGSLSIFINLKKVGEFITFCLSLSMIIMISISIFELIPESLIVMINKYNYVYGIMISFLVFILGYQTVYFINKKINSNNNLYKIGIINMLCLILHNFPEGIAIFISAYNNMKIGIKLCTAIILHNIPEGIIISVPLYYSGYSRGKVILYTLFSALAEPFGALLSIIFLKNIVSNSSLSFIFLFVSGLMISLSINDILKEIISYNKKKYMLIGIIVGLILSLIII